ncbi:MAG: hypothetical protein L6309_01910, partial [Candidatus Omnitrophica bacterium]|nr:hypothetical protein [Candidatus Omnitrophota bacterium]
ALPISLGFIFPSAAIITFLGIRREWRVLKDMKPILGLLLFLAISAPWFIAMIKLHGNEYLGNVWSLEIAKKLNLSSQGGPNPIIHYFSSIFYYLGMVFCRNLPWSAFLPAAIISVPYYAGKKRSLDFLLSWFFAIFVLLTLIWSRESYYVLPLCMPLAIFIGLYFATLTEKNILMEKFLFKLPFIIIVLFTPFALTGWAFFTAYGLGENIILPSLLMFIPIGFLVYAYIRKAKRTLIPAGLIIAAFAFFAYFSVYIISVVDDEPLMAFAEDIKAVIKDGDVIAASSSGASYHRLNVYLDEYDVKNISAPPDSLNEFLSKKDVRVFCVMSKDDYEHLITEKTKKRVYIMAKAFRWRKFEKEDAGYFLKMLSYILHNNRDLFRQSLKYEIYLVSNMP